MKATVFKKFFVRVILFFPFKRYYMFIMKMKEQRRKT